MRAPKNPFFIKHGLTLTSLSDSVKLSAWILILVAIFISANFTIDNKNIEYALWKPLRMLNLDVSMTPLTVDMEFMSPQGLNKVEQLRIRVQDQASNWVSVEFWKLNLQLVKLPLLYLSENARSQSHFEYSLQAICRGLQYNLGYTLQSFKLESESKNNFAVDESVMLQAYSCEGKLY